MGITEKCFATKRWQLFRYFIPQTRSQVCQHDMYKKQEQIPKSAGSRVP